MGIPVMILGNSGTGKTTSLRNLNPERTLLIQAVNKRLPFKAKALGWKPVNRENPNGSVYITDDYEVIKKALMAANSRGKDIVIIDDANYLMTHENLRRVEEKGYGKFTHMALHFWDLVKAAQEVPGDMRVYFMAHTQTDSEGKVSIKTIGKMLDDQIVVEGLFTIVLGAHVRDGKHFFTTKNSGSDTVKTPIDMFDDEEIDNDLERVDNAICEFYGLNENENVA